MTLATSLLESCGLSATKSNLEALRAAARVELISRSRDACDASLGEYVRQAWAYVEPARPYVHGWHIDAICEHLEAVERLEIRNLIINIPPRHMKSLAVSVFWPTWVWGHNPGTQWLFSSYAQGLAIRDAVKSRRLIQSPWYQARWGYVYQLVGDQNQKARYENDQNGHRVSIGVGGQGTGEGGDFLVMDDPLKAKDADSDAVREASNDFWTQTMSTRGNNPQTVRKVIIMQRLHDDDLTGHLVEEMRDEGESYEMLVLPAEYEPRSYVTSLGWSDPRTEPGELLWPERFGDEDVRLLKATLGTRAAAGQLQQRPSPEGGTIYLADWWNEGKNRWDATDKGPSNACVGRWLSFDTALKDDKSNDATAFGVYELWPDYRLAKRHAWWGRVQFPQLANLIRDEAQRWDYDGKLRGVVIEDKVSGTSALQTLRQEADGGLAQLLAAFTPQGSKEYRARQASLWCDRGMVMLPHPSAEVPWLLDWEETLYKFPAVRFDDMVDEFTQMIIYLEHYLAAGWQAAVAGRRP